MNEFELLGFEQSRWIENKYGIKVYIGKNDLDDWCIHIPFIIAENFHGKDMVKTFGKHGLNWYGVSKQFAYRKASLYTESAKKVFG